MTKVLILLTGEEQLYSCDSKQAVISACAMENKLMTQLATGTIYNMKLPIIEGVKTIACGDWRAIK